MHTFRPHRSDGFDKLAVESDTFVVLGGYTDEVGHVGLQPGHLTDRGARRQTGDVCPGLLVGVSSLYDVPRHRPTSVRRWNCPLDRYRVVGDANQTHRRRRSRNSCADHIMVDSTAPYNRKNESGPRQTGQCKCFCS